MLCDPGGEPGFGTGLEVDTGGACLGLRTLDYKRIIAQFPQSEDGPMRQTMIDGQGDG